MAVFFCIFFWRIDEVILFICVLFVVDRILERGNSHIIFKFGLDGIENDTMGENEIFCVFSEWVHYIVSWEGE